jgi:hypothetical protein
MTAMSAAAEVLVFVILCYHMNMTDGTCIHDDFKMLSLKKTVAPHQNLHC